MSSSQQSFTPHGSQSSSSGYPISIPLNPSSFPSSSSFLPQDTTASGSTLVDPNSPKLFKQNIQIAMEHVARVNTLARSALSGIQNAYQAGNSPVQTEMDLTALNQAMRNLAEVLKQSGVGAYPLPAPDNGDLSPPSEQQLIADTTRGVQQLYEQLKHMQESSAVVGNLLAAPESLGRPKA